MRFHKGPVPDTVDFDPARLGWVALHTNAEPSKASSWYYGSAAVLTFVSVVLAWGLVATEPWNGSTFVKLFPPLKLLAALLGMLVLHEIVHLVAHPGLGLSSHSIVGYRFHVGPYVLYRGVLSRNRLIAIVSAPFALFSVLPAVVMIVFPSIRYGEWVVLMAINTSYSLMDVHQVVLLLRSLPASSEIALYQGSAWWRAVPC